MYKKIAEHQPPAFDTLFTFTLLFEHSKIPLTKIRTNDMKFSKTGVCIIGTIFTFTILLLCGVNFDNMYKIFKKYGFWKWDMNAFFIMLPSATWIPVVLYFSSRDLGEKLTKFTQEYMHIDILSSGTV